MRFAFLFLLVFFINCSDKTVGIEAFHEKNGEPYFFDGGAQLKIWGACETSRPSCTKGVCCQKNMAVCQGLDKQCTTIPLFHGCLTELDCPEGKICRSRICE